MSTKSEIHLAALSEKMILERRGAVTATNLSTVTISVM
jgi:hypothetical protein